MDNKTKQRKILKEEMRNGKSLKQKSQSKQNLVVDSQSQMKRNVSDLILANACVVATIIISAFIPFLSLAFPLLFAIYFEIGLSLFVLKKELGQYCKYEDLFVSIKKYLRIFCVAIIKIILILLWSVLLIVPGIVCLIKYSFTGFILAEDNEMDAKSVLLLSTELTKGYRLKICFWGLIFLSSICVAMSLMFSIILIFDVFFNVPSMIYIIFVVASGIFDFIVLAMPMMQIVLADYFLISKQEKTRAI